MSKIAFTTPPLTVLASLDAIPRNVSCTALKTDPVLPDRTVEIERVGNNIRWHQGAATLIFPVESIVSLEMISLQNAGNGFLAAAMTWRSGADSLCYRLITSHESEAAWLKKVLSDILSLLAS
ncbi:MAG: hypothetical protein ACJ8R9_30770 [Steroidobacteraceae bacterium]